MNTTSSRPGGFLRSSLPSPPASASPVGTLPRPRSQPLRPGSPKETAFFQYVENKLLEVSGRYERRFSAGVLGELERGSKAERENGYESFREVAKDLEGILEVVWVSGTPALQIPFLLNIALASSSYLLSFPYSPRPTFSLLRKLDFAFSSILHETDIETGMPLPGFGSGRRLTMTEKVRIRSLVEGTRIHVVRVARNEVMCAEGPIAELTENDGEENMMDAEEEGPSPWDMEVARVYEKTIVDLAPALDGAKDLRTW